VVNAELIAPDRVRLLSRAEYDHMVAQGWFVEDRLELLHGVVVEMSPQGPKHAAVIRRLTNLLVPLLRRRALLQVQSPLATSDDSEPEPDVALVAHGDYDDQHPSTALLVVEVAVTSVVKDRELKGPLYASAGVPEYWLVDLEAGVVEVHTEPRPSGYRLVRRCERGDLISMVELSDVEIAVDALLAD
jgi:Uma2 family endonuclease